VSSPRITLFTRPACHLCDDAKAALDRVGEPWAEVDITGDADLEADYAEMIPVITLDGRVHGYFRVEPDRLTRDLGHG
jgi:glutaredoxin